MNNEISKLIESLSIARGIAATEPGAEILCFLIEQALDEALAEARRRGQPIPMSETSTPQ